MGKRPREGGLPKVIAEAEVAYLACAVLIAASLDISGTIFLSHQRFRSFGSCFTCGQPTPHLHFALRSKSWRLMPLGSLSGVNSTV